MKEADMSTDLKEEVRARYAEAAVRADTGQGCSGDACCAENGCCGDAGPEAFGANLYDPRSQADLPEAALLASLGCGNPIAVADLHEGEVVLDLGSGGGIDVLLSAKRVGPAGLAYGVDMTDEMLDLARRNANGAGVTNAHFLKGDIENIPLPDNSVDVVISNCVVNLSTDKPKVLREIFRVLRPGGRTALSVWATPADNPWLGEMLGAASAELGTPMPPPGVPGPFSLAHADLGALLAAVGFVDVAVEDVPVPHRTGSFDEYWNLTSDLAGPLAAVLAGLDEETTSAIQDRVRAAFVPYSTDAGLDIPGLSRMVSGRRP
jgi:arsenite methyltransferase